MAKINSLKPTFVSTIPSSLEPGVIYVSEKYRTAAHLCCCGCGTKVATPLKPTFWSLTRKGETVSLYPSIGNWSLPCKSHYFIRNNRVVWAGTFSDQEIAAVKARDSADQDAYFNATRPRGVWKQLWDWILRR